MSKKPRGESGKPIIGVIADTYNLNNTRIFSTGQKYIEGLTAIADVIPFIIPTNSLDKMDTILDFIDGLMLTGSPTNVHPSHYNAAQTTSHEPFDAPRDETVFAYVPACLQRNIPILGICRGYQELNVAFGGTLHPAIHEVDGKLDHRQPDTTNRDIKHAPRHMVGFPENGLFHGWTGQTAYQVNSLHRQAVESLGDGLQIEAIAEDGVIEGFSHINQDSFVLAVQWHPEYKSNENIFSQKFFEAFEEAVKK